MIFNFELNDLNEKGISDRLTSSLHNVSIMSFELLINLCFFVISQTELYPSIFDLFQEVINVI